MCVCVCVYIGTSGLYAGSLGLESFSFELQTREFSFTFEVKFDMYNFVNLI